MAGSLEPHQASPAARAERQAPQGVLRYGTSGPVGFERLASEARSAVAPALVGPCFAAGADQGPVVKRRPDGSCYQLQTGWWLAMPASGTGRLVQVEARRELAPADANWRPAGQWRADAKVLLLAPARPRQSTWRPRTDDGRGSGRGGQVPVAVTDDVAQALPPEIWGPMKGAKWSARRTTFADGSVKETVVAALAGTERVRAFAATRTAPSEAARASGTWQVHTLEAIVVSVESLDERPVLGAAHRPLPAPRPRPPSLPR